MSRFTVNKKAQSSSLKKRDSHNLPSNQPPYKYQGSAIVIQGASHGKTQWALAHFLIISQMACRRSPRTSLGYCSISAPGIRRTIASSTSLQTLSSKRYRRRVQRERVTETRASRLAMPRLLTTNRRVTAGEPIFRTVLPRVAGWNRLGSMRTCARLPRRFAL